MLKHITGLPGVYPVPGKRQAHDAPKQAASGDDVILYGNQQPIPGKQAYSVSLPVTYHIVPEQMQQIMSATAAAVNASFSVSSTPGPAGYVVGIGESWLQDDSMNNGGELINFRLCTDPFLEFPGSRPSRAGLDELNISGSSQFTPQALVKMKERIPHKNIIMIDLREETHFYSDTGALSWRNFQNNLNMGATEEEINRLEAQWLNNLQRKEGTMGLRPRTVSTEEELCRQSGIGYCRIPVTDHTGPEDRDVDQFVNLIRTMPEDTWLNFHCKAGKGRTTTFMAMYDMMHNAGRVSARDIGQRQFLLGGIDLLGEKVHKDEYRKAADHQRKKFVLTFYQYCVENRESNFATGWSEWKKSKGI